MQLSSISCNENAITENVTLKLRLLRWCCHTQTTEGVRG